MKLIFLVIFSFCVLHSFSQSKNTFYALDAKMNQTALDSSKYMLWIHQKEDNNWQWDYFYTWGTMIKSNSYADFEGTIRNGKFYLYNAGLIDSTGDMDHGKKAGRFTKYKNYGNDSLRMVRQYEYEKDSLIRIIDYTHHKDTAGIAQSMSVDTVASQDTASTFTRVEMESEFPGGVTAWQEYLAKHLTYPKRALDKKIEGSVKVGFVVGKDGTVEEVYIIKSVEYSIDQAVVQLMKNSPKWSPAIQDGQPVRSYKSQSVNLKLP